MNDIPEPKLAPPTVFDDGLIPPPSGESRRIVATEEELEAIEEAAALAKAEEVETLSDDERNLFRSLLTIGSKIETHLIMDHAVVLRTLNNADEMRIGLYTKDYEGTRGFARAYQCAIMAAAIVSIDGTELYQPLSDKEDDEAIFDHKFKVVRDMYPIVTSQIYDKVTSMEAGFVELAKRLGKIPG